MGLKDCQAKRNFEATPEPSGRLRSRGQWRFVVQDHSANYRFKTMPRRVARLGDRFDPVLRQKQSLVQAQKRLDKLATAA